MSRVFLSYSSRDKVAALALKTWLERAEPGLAGEIFFDRDVDSGIPAGVRWKEALRKANDRCEAVICLLSEHWDNSHECKLEYRNAEDRGKPIFVARLGPLTGRDITSEWQRCDLFGDGPLVTINVDGSSVALLEEGLRRLQRGLYTAGIAPDSFRWPPDGDPWRAPFRGWQPLESVDAAVYFGRDTELNRALSGIRELRSAGENKAFVILGPSGVGKSSFLRAGLLPRLDRDDRHFVVMDIVRPQQLPMTGQHGLAHSIHALRSRLGLRQPTLGRIKSSASDVAAMRRWLSEAQHAALERVLDEGAQPPPTIVLPVDQSEELLGADDSGEAATFFEAIAGLLGDGEAPLPMVVVATVRSDRYEPLQTAPQLASVRTEEFADLKPMPSNRYREVICGPADRAERAGGPLRWAPELVERLLLDCSAGADALPLLALTLARLYEDFGSGTVGLAEYEAMGGMRRVVEMEIDRVLSSDPMTRRVQLDQLHDAFIPWLVTINPANDQPMRRAARWNSLPAGSHELIDNLVARRLLIKDDRNGDVVVEVALESFLRQWDQIGQWLEMEAGDLKNADSLEQEAREWNANDRGDAWLLEGQRLTNAEGLVAKTRFADRLKGTREYLTASRHREDRRTEEALRVAQERRAAAEALAEAEASAKRDAEAHAAALTKRSRMLWAALAMTVVLVVAAVFGWWSTSNARNEAHNNFREATAQWLSGESQLMLSGDSFNGSPDLAIVHMLLAAMAISSDYQSEEYRDAVLQSALNKLRDVEKIIHIPSAASSVTYDPATARIASSHSDGTVQLWSADSGRRLIPPIRGHEGPLTSVEFSPDGRRLASSGTDGSIRLWDSRTGVPLGLAMTGHEGEVYSVTFSADGRLVASGGDDTTVRIWDTQTGQQVGPPLRGSTKWVKSVAMSPDGSRVASGDGDGVIRQWSVRDRRQISEPIEAHDGAVMSVAYSPDGSRLASGGDDKKARLWDSATTRRVGEPFAHQNMLHSVAFSADGSTLVTAGRGDEITLWDVAAGRRTGTFSGHEGVVSDAELVGDGRRLVSASGDGTIRIWDTRSWLAMTGHEDDPWAMFSHDGTRVLSGGADGTVRHWDSSTGIQIGTPLRVRGDVEFLLPIDEKRLISFGEDVDSALWDARSGERIGGLLRLPGDPYNVSDTAGRRIAVETETGVVQMWSTDTMKPMGWSIRLDTPVSQMTFTDDGSVLAIGEENGSVRLWHVETGELISQLEGGNVLPSALVFSGDGDQLAVARYDYGVELWDTDTGVRLDDPGLPLPVDALITAGAFSRDRQQFATGEIDGSIKLWGVSDEGFLLGTSLEGHQEAISSLEFSSDGTRLLSASQDDTLRIWPVPRAERQALCEKVTHNITREAWDMMISDEIDYVTLCPGLPESEFSE